jgi:hypothetical protein
MLGDACIKSSALKLFALFEIWYKQQPQLVLAHIGKVHYRTSTSALSASTYATANSLADQINR